MERCYGCKIQLDKIKKHYRDGNKKNNSKYNIFNLCNNCYRIVHYGFKKNLCNYRRDVILRLSRLRESWLINTGRKQVNIKYNHITDFDKPQYNEVNILLSTPKKSIIIN